ncbi:hypothetical protein B0H14DRAFT_2904902 [Mycena olivaceomarginata]|nr:hypothetical protein B0H14DRAFT_2904902 [Mycena olivaceomarginata]
MALSPAGNTAVLGLVLYSYYLNQVLFADSTITCSIIIHLHASIHSCSYSFVWLAFLADYFDCLQAVARPLRSLASPSIGRDCEGVG